MNILVVGQGGREHALVTALAESASAPQLFAWPGSDAIAETATLLQAEDLPSLIATMKSHEIDLCVAGEESWLVKDEGLSATCAAAGIPCWGPPKESAQLEASKWFAKEFMVRHDIPTGACSRVGSLEEARAAITKYPVVLKFDGLAAGKGVAVCADEAEAEAFLDEVYLAKRFGEAPVLVEECLKGPEVSIFCAVSNGEYQILAPARDYKRIADGDEGPNTGGMGAVAGRDLITPELLAEIEETAVARTVAGLGKDGLPYCGFLYFGFMLTPDGPRMLEYNCRFGDPECQAVMPLVDGDLAEYVAAGAKGQLKPELLRFHDGWSVCLVLASKGYPASSHSGDLISGLNEVTNARIYHAGTRKTSSGDGYETAGGRVLAVVARGATREEAVENAYAQSQKIDFDGCQRRSDVGRLHFEA